MSDKRLDSLHAIVDELEAALDAAEKAAAQVVEMPKKPPTKKA